MKKILIFLFFISIIACKKNENKEISFESIEISYINGFTASGGTIVIQKDGSILDYYQGYPFEIDSSFYLLNSLKNKELNIISKQLLDIMKIKIDTIYGEDCPDCSSTYVLIKTKSKTINSKLLHNSIDNKLISFCDSIYKSRNIFYLIKQKKFNPKKRIFKKMYFETYGLLIPKPKFPKQ